jgi:hypothetical protein
MRHLIAVAALVAAFVFLAPIASAHEWYSKRRDPIYNAQTCCRNDCGPVPSQYIHRDPATGLIRVIIPLEAAKKIYHARIEAVDEVIPPERIQTSEDGQIHICLQSRGGNAMQGFWCFFVPPNG